MNPMSSSDGTGCPQPVARRGFTLIEIMVVVAILGTLAGMVAPDVFHQLWHAKAEAARSQIEMLGVSLDSYRLDNNQYPTGIQGLSALRREPLTGPGARNWRGPYIQKELPMDPWGNPYQYRNPGVGNPDGYDLFSYGADGQEGGTGEDADVTNWF